MLDVSVIASMKQYNTTISSLADGRGHERDRARVQKQREQQQGLFVSWRALILLKVEQPPHHAGRARRAAKGVGDGTGQRPSSQEVAQVSDRNKDSGKDAPEGLPAMKASEGGPQAGERGRAAKDAAIYLHDRCDEE